MTRALDLNVRLKYPIPEKVVGKIAFDFDQTLAKGTWPSPECGTPIPEGIAGVRFYYERGFGVFIFTARPRSHSERMWRWLAVQGIAHMIYDIVFDKPHFDLLIDDRAINFPGGLQ